MNATIVMPLPDRCLSPNSRSHWGKKADKKRLLRYQSRCSCLSVVNSNSTGAFPLETTDYIIRYYHKTARFMDEDNILASLKAAIDGAIDAGLIEDDRDAHIKGVERYKDPLFPRVEIVFTGSKKIESSREDDACLWERSPRTTDASDLYDTECGELMVKYEEFNYCPYCSKEILMLG